MANFCRHCGNELKGTDKFCTKCGTPVVRTDNTTPLDKENIQDTVKNLKATMGNVSAAAKEKAKQAAQYSKNIVQDEEFRNEQTDILKKKAKQAQEYLQSEEFQNVKSETVDKTKNTVKKFFSCNIKNNDDYIKAEKQRKYCLYAIFASAAVIIVLLPFFIPFFDKWYWVENGLLKSVLHILFILSGLSKVIGIPVIIICFFKYHIINTALIRYRAANIGLSKHGINKKKTLALFVVSIAVCLIMMPVMKKTDDTAWYNHYFPDSNSSDKYSSSVSNGATATDFEIVGGSSTVHIMASGKNYSVDCPLCGHKDGAAVGTHEIQSQLSKHKAGETADIQMSMMCASKFQGGCRRLFDYYVTVKFK